MTRWVRGGRRLAVIRRGVALLLVIGLVAPPTPGYGQSSKPVRPKAPTIYHKNRSFRIPFSVDPSERERLQEVQLFASQDSGYSWKMESRTNPERPAFTFRSSHDGEYWFAVRTLDKSGQVFPATNEDVEPSMKVVVDTVPPSIVLTPDGRRGSLAATRWEVRDENIDFKSLVLEYQVEGGRDWRTVPVRRPSLIGSESWDAGTAEPLKVRASVSDKAGNVGEAVIVLGEGMPANPGFARDDMTKFGSPPVSQVSNAPTFANGGDVPIGPSTALAPSPAPSSNAGGELFGSAPPELPANAGNAMAGGGLPPPEIEGFGTGNAVIPAPTIPEGPGPAPAEPGTGNGGPLLVSSPRFPLQYEVKDAGPSGPATVELWATQDGGRTWFRKGDDPDKTSPIMVDLGSEGTFGLRLVARSASGLGDAPPAPGDAPDTTVEVDSTAPTVEIAKPTVGTGANFGKVAIQWHAADVHLGGKPVLLSWRGEASGARWQPIAEPLENSGKYIWTVPANVPPRFHVRVDVVDSAGNRGYAETTETGPVVLDRTRPRSRIIGLDPSAKSGSRSDARTMR